MQEQQRRNYTGYMGFMYRQRVNENLRAGLMVQEAIELAQESMSHIPKLNIVDSDNPLVADYFDSQREEVKNESIS